MSFWHFLQLNWPELLLLVRQHIVLVFISILVAVLIGVPTGILLTRYRALRGPVLGIANVMQTIPSLALFGFLIPLPFIGGIGSRTAPDGWVIPSTDSATSTPNAAAMAPVASANGRDDFTQRCQAARSVLRDWSSTSTNDWRSWTAGRVKARRAVAANEAALRQIAGTEWDGKRWNGCPAPPAPVK